MRFNTLYVAVGICFFQMYVLVACLQELWDTLPTFQEKSLKICMKKQETFLVKKISCVKESFSDFY